MTQQKIPFIFLSPIPKFFKEKGFLKNPKNAAFLLWCFERCSYEAREIFHDNQLITLQPYQFIFGRRVCCDETGLTDNEIRHQQELWEKLHFLKKGTNKTPNRFTIYEWSTECFSLIHHQQNHQQTTNSPPTEQPQTRTREPIELKEQTEHVVVCLFSCLDGLGLSKEDMQKICQYPEAEVKRAVQSMNEFKKTKFVKNPMGFLISALNRKFKPKENPKFELTPFGKKNQEEILRFKNRFQDQIQDMKKDIEIDDIGDSVKFGFFQVSYEDVEFGKKIGSALQHYNLTHLVKTNKAKPIAEVVEEGKILHMQHAGSVGNTLLNQISIKN